MFLFGVTVVANTISGATVSYHLHYFGEDYNVASFRRNPFGQIIIFNAETVSLYRIFKAETSSISNETGICGRWFYYFYNSRSKYLPIWLRIFFFNGKSCLYLEKTYFFFTQTDFCHALIIMYRVIFFYKISNHIY